MAFERKLEKINPFSELGWMLSNQKARKHPWGFWRLNFSKEEALS